MSAGQKGGGGNLGPILFGAAVLVALLHFNPLGGGSLLPGLLDSVTSATAPETSQQLPYVGGDRR